MYRISGANEEISGSGNNQRTRSPQQSFVDWNEVPQTFRCMRGKPRGQIAGIGGR
jgi:hypothetical protein